MPGKFITKKVQGQHPAHIRHPGVDHREVEQGLPKNEGFLDEHELLLGNHGKVTALIMTVHMHAEFPVLNVIPEVPDGMEQAPCSKLFGYGMEVRIECDSGLGEEFEEFRRNSLVSVGYRVRRCVTE
jgi:hypothetical protein